MKAIVYSVFPGTPHLETDLELISSLLEQKAKVYMVRCFGELETCLVNARHEKGICDWCILKYDKGFDLCGLPENRIIRLPKVDQKIFAGIPGVFSSVEELKSFKIDNVDFGMAAIGTLISRFAKDHKFDTIEKRLDVHKELRMSVTLYHSFLHILDRIRPDVVYLFNGRFSTHRPVVRACENKNVTFVTHERAGKNDEYSLRINALPQDLGPAKDEITDLWNSANSERIGIAKKFYEDRRNNLDQGWVSFTKYQQIGKLPEAFDRKKKNIAIFDSTIEENESIESWKNQIYKDEIDGLRQLFDSFRENSSIHFNLRVHPNLMGFDNTQIREIRKFGTYANVTIIMPENKTHTYSLLESCDCVITYGSTVGVEACYWGKPSILCGRAYYEDLDCCYIPSNHDDLVRLVSSDLKAKSKESSYKYGYWELARGVAYKYFEPIGLFDGLFKGTKLDSISKEEPLIEKIAFGPALNSVKRIVRLLSFGKQRVILHWMKRIVKLLSFGKQRVVLNWMKRIGKLLLVGKHR